MPVNAWTTKSLQTTVADYIITDADRRRMIRNLYGKFREVDADVPMLGQWDCIANRSNAVYLHARCDRCDQVQIGRLVPA